MIKELEQKGYCKFKKVFPKKFIYELKIKCLEIAEDLSVELIIIIRSAVISGTISARTVL